MWAQLLFVDAICCISPFPHGHNNDNFAQGIEPRLIVLRDEGYQLEGGSHQVFST